MAAVERRRFRKVLGLIAAVSGLLIASPGLLAFPELRLSAQQIDSGSLQISDATLSLAADGQFTLAAGRIRDDVSQWDFSAPRLDGKLLEWSDAEGTYALRADARYQGIDSHLSLSIGDTSLDLRLWWDGQPLSNLSSLEVAPPELQWLSGGRFAHDVTARFPDKGATDIGWTIELSAVDFDSPDGRFAAAALEGTSSGRLLVGEENEVAVTGAIRGGEILLGNFYSDFSAAPLQFELQPAWEQDGTLALAFRVHDDGALNTRGRVVSGSGDLDTPWDVYIEDLRLDFPLAYERYVEPVAAAWDLDGLEVTGAVSWRGSWQNGALSSGDLDITDLSVVDIQRGRFAVTGLQTRLRPGDHTFDSALAWQGLLFGRINLGPGRARLDSEPGTVALAEPLELNVLGGRLFLDRLRILLPGSAADLAGEKDFTLQARLEGMEMARLTAAMDWPRFNGLISGEIPGASLDNGVLSVDGEISIRVFGGRVTIGDLSVERPFGVLPSLGANVKVEQLDLAQLTETFSFGSISGQLDGHVEELRMLDWEPVAFDAWFGTPPQQSKSKGISRQAVKNLTTIGGGGATAALSGPIMGLFDNFSYKRLGLGCRLRNNVCEISGIAEDDLSVLLLEGAGIPKITIRAYNRRVDWPQLVANLKSATGEGTIEIGQ